MTGLLPNSIANFISRVSGYQIDGSRSGAIVTMSPKQQKIKGAYVVACMAVGGCLTDFLRRQIMDSNSSPVVLLSVCAGVTLGLVYSHKDMIAERRKQRAKLKSDIASCLAEIELYGANTSFNKKIKTVLSEIDVYEVKEKGQVKALLTLKAKLKAYKIIQTKLEKAPKEKNNDSVFDEAEIFWDKSVQDILSQCGITIETSETEDDDVLASLGFNALSK